MKTQSVEYMPFFLSFCSFLCGTSWFIYGLLGKDPFVAVSTVVSLWSYKTQTQNYVCLCMLYVCLIQCIHINCSNFQVPNGFGCGLGILQLILYATYCGNKGQTKKTADGSSLELGQANGDTLDKPNLKQAKHQCRTICTTISSFQLLVNCNILKLSSQVELLCYFISQLAIQLAFVLLLF